MTRRRKKRRRARKATRETAKPAPDQAAEPSQASADGALGESSAAEASASPTTAKQTWLAVACWLVLALAFAAGAVYLTWPLASGLDGGIALGSERIATVPLFNLWTLAWNVESVGRGFDGYWQAPIFHPTPDAFAFSEPQPLLGLLAALLTVFGLEVLAAYNPLLIASLALNGLLATALLRYVGLAWLPALAGGVLVLLLPFSHQELGVLQLVPLAGVLTFAWTVLRFAKTPSRGAGAALGGALALAYVLSAQVAVFCALAATPVALWLWWPHRGLRQAWTALATGIALFFVLVSPLLVAQTRATANEDFVRAAETVRKHSARPAHYLETPWPTLVPTPFIDTTERSSGRAFWPGSLRVLLAAIGLVLAWRSTRWRRLAVAGGLALTTSILLSFGGHLAIGSLTLPDVLAPIPGLGQIRSFFRFALFAQLALAALAAVGLQLLFERATRRFEGRRLIAPALIALVALPTALEMRPDPTPIEPLPPLDLQLPWIDWIESSTSEHEIFAFLPFPEGRSAGDYLGTSQWMFWQIRHWRPMVNGYSGFFPKRFKKIKKTMQDFPSSESLAELQDAGVRYCVVPRAYIEASPPPDPDSPIQLDLVFRDEEHELAIFELRSQ